MIPPIYPRTPHEHFLTWIVLGTTAVVLADRTRKNVQRMIWSLLPWQP